MASCTLVWGSGEFTFDAECRTAGDCPATDDPCMVSSCSEGQCSTSFVPPNTPLPEDPQDVGDCMVQICDEQGNAMTVPSNTDVPVDGVACTDDVCDQGSPDNPPSEQGTLCSDGVCDGSGNCVPASCDNGQQDGTETDIDCGGPCPSCAVGQSCAVDDDCRTTVCDSMVCAPVNGCDPETATDLTGMDSITINFQGNSYNPSCVRINAGTTVTFSGNFNSRNMVGGKVIGGEPMPDRMSPFYPPTESGSMASWELTMVGVEPYHCPTHINQGMFGAIFVE